MFAFQLSIFHSGLETKYLTTFGTILAVFALYALVFIAISRIIKGNASNHAKNSMPAAYPIALMLVSSACFSAVSFTCSSEARWCTLDALPGSDSFWSFITRWHRDPVRVLACHSLSLLSDIEESSRNRLN